MQERELRDRGARALRRLALPLLLALPLMMAAPGCGDSSDGGTSEVTEASWETRTSGAESVEDEEGEAPADSAQPAAEASEGG